MRVCDSQSLANATKHSTHHTNSRTRLRHSCLSHSRIRTYPLDEEDFIMSLLIGLFNPLGFSFVNSIIFGEPTCTSSLPETETVSLLLHVLLLLLLVFVGEVVAVTVVLVEGELIALMKDVRVSGGPGVIDRAALGFIGFGFVLGEGGAEREGRGNSSVGEIVTVVEGRGDAGAEEGDGEEEVEETEEVEGDTGKRGDVARLVSLGAGDEEESTGAGQLGRSLPDCKNKQTNKKKHNKKMMERSVSTSLPH